MGATGSYDMNRLMVDGSEGSQGNVEMYSNDDESIVQQDLVLWLGLATHHLPTSENMPMTSGIKHGFSIMPWNFHDEQPTMDMPIYLRMMPGESGERGDDGSAECASCVSSDIPSAPTCTPRTEDCTHSFAGVW